MQIKTVGELREALERFEDSDSLNLVVSDDFGTYGLGAVIQSSNGPGTKNDKPSFFNNEGAMINLKLTAESDDYRAVPMKTKVTKRN